MEYFLICAIVVVIEAVVLMGISAFICKNKSRNFDFSAVFCIVDLIFIVIASVFCFLTINNAHNDMDMAYYGGICSFFVVPPLIILLIIGAVSFGIRKYNKTKTERILKKAEDEIENLLKNSDMINKDKT